MSIESSPTPLLAAIDPNANNILFVLGKNFGKQYGYKRIANDPWNLSQDSRVTAIAAGMLIEEALATDVSLDVAFTTGRTAGNKIPPESEAQIDYMVNRFPGLLMLRPNISAGERGFDTYGDAQEAREHLHARDYDNSILLTTGYHGPNARDLFEALGARIDTLIASEDVLSKRGPHHHAFVERWKDSDRIKQEISKEATRARILSHDHEGRLIHALAWAARKLPRI